MTGEYLRAFLKKRHYNLAEIARGLGISQQHLNGIFSVQDVKTGTIQKLAEVLNISPCEFFDDSITAIDHSLALRGDGNNIQTTDRELLAIIRQQTEQITTAQRQITDLIDILKTK